MNKYRIVGAKSSTGEDIEIEVEAATERDAVDVARQRGIFVSSVNQIAEERAKSALVVPVPMSGGKLFLLITGAVACGLMLALLLYGAFFAATRTVTPNNDSPAVLTVGESTTPIISSGNSNSGLTDEEEAFIATIGSGDFDRVRDYLVKPLNWRKVSTPALNQLLIANKLGAWRDKFDEQKEEREFWRSLAERLVENGADVNEALGCTYDINGLRFLIAHKANVNTSDGLGDTSLHRLASDTWDDEVALLIASGANVNAIGYGGDTPLHRAAKEGAVKVIERLLAAGASINVKNKAGQTPLAIANLAMQKDAAALLKSWHGME